MVLASLAALERSHRRHDEVMAELLAAARRFAAGRPDADDLGRVRDAVAYFERTVTRDFVDEDGSVFPRLSTRRPELAAALAELSAEHPTQITLQTEVAAAAHELDGEARPSAGKTLLDAATRLAETHHAHVDREDAIFARAHEALTAEDDREIVAEMETRRDRKDESRRRIDDRPAVEEALAATPRPRARAADATTTLTTRRASVASRSSAKRSPPAPATRSASSKASTSDKSSRPAAKPTRPAAKPTRPAAKSTRPAAKPSKPAAKPSKPAAKSSKPTKAAARQARSAATRRAARSHRR